MMVKQLYLLALFCMGASLYAMNPATDAGAQAFKTPSYDELTHQQQRDLGTLNFLIFEYIYASDSEFESALAALKKFLMSRVFVETPFPDTNVSILSRIDALIQDNKEALANFLDGSHFIATERRKTKERLETVKELLHEHVNMPILSKTNSQEPKAKSSAEHGPKGTNSAGAGKNGYPAWLTRKNVLVTLSFVGLGYIVWSRFLATSTEDKK